MKIACLSFTKSGELIALDLSNELEDDVDCYFKGNYKQNLNAIYSQYDAIVFISSTGIATRVSAPFLKDKTRDPAIVVIDDMGQYAISLVSGHLGGANDLARNIAEVIGCQPIITTASDNRGFDAIDVYAKKNGLVIEDIYDVKTITAMMVDGKTIAFSSKFSPVINYPNVSENDPEGQVFVDYRTNIKSEIPFCILRPKVLIVGIGCKKGKRKNEIESAIKNVFEENQLSIKSLTSITSIDLKKDEKGLKEAARSFKCELKFYNKEDLKPVQHLFDQSEFVEETTGVGSVCEACAYLGENELIVRKSVTSGITIAVSVLNQS